MGIKNIDLTDYDNVVAVSQLAINEVMATWLNSRQQDVALYATVDEQGDIILVPNESEAAYIFTATLDYATDEQGRPVNLVQLYTDQGNQTVQYNMTFQNGHFQSLIPPLWNDVQGPGEVWMASFTVNLGLAATDIQDTPAEVQDKFNAFIAGSDYEASMFSVQQLYLNLNTASYTAFDGISGMSTLSNAVLGEMMVEYLRILSAEGAVIWGYAMSYTGSNAPPPTFAPTYVNYCVTPYLDAQGNASNPDLDTLNYLVMVENNRPPGYPPQSFPFNFVDSTEEQGVMAIAYNLYQRFITDELTSLLQLISPTVYVEADNKEPVDDQVLRLEPSSVAQGFTLFDPANGSQVATYSYSDSASDSDGNGAFAQMSVGATYGSACTIAFSGNKISLSGYCATEASMTATVLGQSTNWQMPKTTYNWALEMEMYMNLEQNGQVALVVSSANFDDTPTVEGHDQSWWEAWANALGGNMTIYVDQMGSLLPDIENSVMTQILPALNQALNQMNSFVFPGGNTFLFQDPQFSDALDLASQITYITPDPA